MVCDLVPEFVEFNDLMLFRNNWLWKTVTGDFDIDGDVDFKDFSVFSSAWLTASGEEKYKPQCDISIPADNVIDWLDLAVLAEHWLAGK